ncbi:MAG: GntR family transcriptional regulator [Burkholderiaceae bacterium]|nr:GntR family transcriptional regulator [Burkholderiaceae bacterium]
MTPKPRFSDIAAHLREAIRTGHFAVGSVLPTELELCSHYNTSRHTIRAALTELQQLGLVSRRKNAGTRVESAQPTSGFQQSLASMDDLVQFGASHSRAVLQVAEITVSAAVAHLLGCEEGSRWQRITSLRLKSGAVQKREGLATTNQVPTEPIGLTEVYVLPRFEGLERLVRQSPDVLISSLLESHYAEHIAEVTQDLCATALPTAVAQKLGVEAQSPGLRIIRRYVNAGSQTVEISVTHHPAERFAMRTRLVRAG